MKKVILLVIAIVVFISLIYRDWKQRDQRQQQELEIPLQQEDSALQEGNKEPAIRFPVQEIQPQVEDQGIHEDQDTGEEPEQEKPLPPLEQSDDETRDLLAGLIGQETLMELFNLKDMIRHIVVTIDNLPRKQYAVKYLPTKPVAGRIVVTGNDENAVIKTDNYRRYTPYVQLMESVDTKTTVSLYTRLYPLFQQAYEELGYPSDYFNDRLIEVIDNLLDTPAVKDPVRLVRPNVLYEYADEELEALSAGQKILVRMGNNNAQKIKTKLREFRHELTAGKTDE